MQERRCGMTVQENNLMVQRAFSLFQSESMNVFGIKFITLYCQIEIISIFIEAMKKIQFVLVALCFAMTASAQESDEKDLKDHAVYLELLGGSSLAGVNYDARFNSHTRWGWRAGLSFTYTNRNGFTDTYTEDTRYWAVPVEVNYLLGSHKNSLELGLGASLGIYNGHYYLWHSWLEEISKADFDRYGADYSLLPNGAGIYYNDNEQKAYLIYNESDTKSRNRFGYFFFGDIAYRHVANSGFFFRAGITQTFNFGGKHAINPRFSDDFHKFSLSFQLSFGWAF